MEADMAETERSGEPQTKIEAMLAEVRKELAPNVFGTYGPQKLAFLQGQEDGLAAALALLRATPPDTDPIPSRDDFRRMSPSEVNRFLASRGLSVRVEETDPDGPGDATGWRTGASWESNPAFVQALDDYNEVEHQDAAERHFWVERYDAIIAAAFAATPPDTDPPREYDPCEMTHAKGTTHYHPLRVSARIKAFEKGRASGPDFVAQAERIRSEHEATHGEAEMCGAECIVLGLATFDDTDPSGLAVEAALEQLRAYAASDLPATFREGVELFTDRIEAAIQESRAGGGLDEAWAEAEAAAQKLGSDWHVAVVNRDVHGDEYHGWRASANDEKYLEQSRHADTPAAALRALAARLSGSGS